MPILNEWQKSNQIWTTRPGWLVCAGGLEQPRLSGSGGAVMLSWSEWPCLTDQTDALGRATPAGGPSPQTLQTLGAGGLSRSGYEDSSRSWSLPRPDSPRTCYMTLYVTSSPAGVYCLRQASDPASLVPGFCVRGGCPREPGCLRHSFPSSSHRWGEASDDRELAGTWLGHPGWGAAVVEDPARSGWASGVPARRHSRRSPGYGG